MKRLRKFNESKVDIDYDYIYQCFAEILDENKAEIREYKNDYTHYITIDLDIRKFNPEKRDTGPMKIQNAKIIGYINDVKYNNELLQEVEVALNRLSDEYPEYKVGFDVFPYSIFINIHAGEEEK